MTDNDYYDKTLKMILVPVRIRYYSNIDLLIDWTPPTKEDIEKSIKSHEDIHKNLFSARASLERALRIVKEQIEFNPVLEGCLKDVEGKLAKLL